MSSYLVLIYQDEQRADAATDDERTALHGEHADFMTKHQDAIRGGDALQRTTTARSLRSAGTVTDGPFAETKEALAGFYLIEAADLDAAIAVAKDVPAPTGGVEIRPVMVFS